MATSSEPTRHTKYTVTGLAQGAQPAMGPGATIEMFVAAGALGPFVTAFCAELGKRLGGTTADWVSKVRRRKKLGDASEAELIVRVDDAGTVLVLEENLPDEARLAFLDLDLKAPMIRGHQLRWSADSQAWVLTDTK